MNLLAVFELEYSLFCPKIEESTAIITLDISSL